MLMLNPKPEPEQTPPAGTIRVQERWYADGRCEIKIGDGPWEVRPSLYFHGQPPFVRIPLSSVLQRLGISG